MRLGAMSVSVWSREVTAERERTAWKIHELGESSLSSVQLHHKKKRSRLLQPLQKPQVAVGESRDSGVV